MGAKILASVLFFNIFLAYYNVGSVELLNVQPAPQSFIQYYRGGNGGTTVRTVEPEKLSNEPLHSATNYLSNPYNYGILSHQATSSQLDTTESSEVYYGEDPYNEDTSQPENLLNNDETSSIPNDFNTEATLYESSTEPEFQEERSYEEPPTTYEEKPDERVIFYKDYRKPSQYEARNLQTYNLEGRSLIEHDKHKKEVHYHKHKHLHEHSHKQEHIHKHKDEHDHKHEHKHKQEHHEHHKHHQHHKHEHKHGHKHGHHHGHKHEHHQEHKHEHKHGHKHGHHHGHKHEHHQDHKHEHKHHHGHKHEHHQDHKHEHGHEHDHHQDHSHGHHHKHHHGHEHKHGHKAHHDHKHGHKHEHKHGHKSHYRHY